jgi:hypothetical protein
VLGEDAMEALLNRVMNMRYEMLMTLTMKNTVFYAKNAGRRFV